MSPFRLISAGFLLLASVFLAACSFSLKPPEATVETFFQAINARDFDLAMEQLDELPADVGGFIDSNKIRDFLVEAANRMEELGGLKRVEVLESKVFEEGKRAEVKVNVVLNDETSESLPSVPLRLVYFHWKIQVQKQ